MSIVTETSQKQRFNQYAFVPNINPLWTQYQRITGVNSGNAMSFRAERPSPNVMLSAKAYIKWTVTIQRNQVDNALVATPTDFPADQDETALYRKPYMVMANSTSNVRISINGYSINYSRPTDWMKYVGLMLSTENQQKKYFSTCGSPFTEGLGSYDDQFLLVGAELNSEANADDNIQIALNDAFQDYVGALGNSELATFVYLEPLQYGIFNPYYDMKEDLPSESWYARMSDTIPYVHAIEVNIDLEKIAANNFVFPYSLSVVDETVEMRDQPLATTGELVLQWICPRDPPPIPSTVSLPSWQVERRSFQVNGGVRVANLAESQFNGDIQHYHTVPDYVLIFATHDKQSDEYVCDARVVDDDGNGGNQNSANGEVGSEETNMAIANLQLRIEINNIIVDTRWSDQELYNVTAKNCREIPFGFRDWVGGFAQFSTTPSKAFVLFKADDLNVKWSSGTIRHDWTLQLETLLQARTGYNFQNPGFVEDATYRLHIVLFYRNFFIDIDNEGKVTSRLLSYFI